MFCKFCGRQIDDTSYVCPYCGNNLSNSSQGFSNPNYSNNQNYQNYGNYQNMQNSPYSNGNNYYQQQDTSNSVAIVGFVFSFLIPIVGLICSIMGYNKAVKERRNHKGLALAGIIISICNWIFNFYLLMLMF